MRCNLQMAPANGGPVPDHLNLRVAPCYSDVRRGLQAICTWLTAIELDREEVTASEHVLAEALNNVVEHGGLRDDQVISLKLSMAGGRLLCRIGDPGRGYPDGILPAGEVPAIPSRLADMPEGGFGWMLIRQFAEDVSYRRMARGNLLLLSIPIGGLKAPMPGKSAGATKKP